MIRHRATAVLLTGALLGTAAAGCGGGGGGASKGDYQSSLNTFCTDVKGAATQVQTDATKLQSNVGSDPKKAIAGFGTTLQTFADTTRTALGKLQKTGVPSDYKTFNDKAVKAFNGVITKLDAAAKGAKSGNIQALSSLGTDLNSVKLPDLPKDLAKNAKACGDITSK